MITFIDSKVLGKKVMVSYMDVAQKFLKSDFAHNNGTFELNMLQFLVSMNEHKGMILQHLRVSDWQALKDAVTEVQATSHEA